MDNLSLADISTALGNNGMGGNSAWLIILFVLIFGWGGFNRQGDLNQYATAASQNEILSGQKFDAVSRQINAVGDGLSSATFALNNTITNEGRSLQSQLADCCCKNQSNVDALRYDMAQQNQKILDAISQSKIDSLAAQVNALQLQNAMAGVVRYPSASVYSSGSNPFCGCGCSGGV